MYPDQAPWTGIGALQQEIREVRNALQRKADDHEIRSLNSRVNSLEYTVRDFRSEIDGVLSKLQLMEQDILSITQS